MTEEQQLNRHHLCFVVQKVRAHLCLLQNQLEHISTIFIEVHQNDALKEDVNPVQYDSSSVCVTQAQASNNFNEIDSFEV